jgi:plastocyanin domain-containing protein
MKGIVVSLVLLGLLAAGSAGSSVVVAGAKEKVRRIQVQVTSRGFEPATIPVKVGTPIVLVVTRTTDRTCAKEFEIADRKLRKTLPLNRAVEIRFTAAKPCHVRFACGMDMVAGTLVVE